MAVDKKRYDPICRSKSVAAQGDKVRSRQSIDRSVSRKQSQPSRVSANMAAIWSGRRSARRVALEGPRPATKRAYEKAKEINPNAGGIRTAEERAILFGQTAAVVR